MTARRTIYAAVVGHLALSALHGVPHATIPVPIADWQTGYVAVVVLSAPVVGAALIAADRSRTGLRVLLAAGIGAFAFEGLFHFVIANPDHVSNVDDGRVAFGATAALSMAGDLLLTGVTGWRLWIDGRPPRTTATTPAE